MCHQKISPKLTYTYKVWNGVSKILKFINLHNYLRNYQIRLPRSNSQATLCKLKS